MYLTTPSLSTTSINGLVLPTSPANNLSTCSKGGRFFNPSTELDIQLITDSACDASLNAAGC